jgi:LemA protein
MLPLVLVAVATVLTVWGVGLYNRLVGLRNRYRNAFSQIDVQLKRRYDLIPNLVETAKGYLKHERGTLEAVITARNLAVSANARAASAPGEPAAMKDLSGAESGLAGALGRLLALSEAYPDLKANTTMLRLMEELTSTENKVSFARQSFNDAVMSYNIAREQFPSSMVASATGFGEAQLFELSIPAEREAPRVAFG